MFAYNKMNMGSKNISSHIYKEMSACNKMDFESNTVKQLRIIAKERGVKGYWSLRKADLIAKIKSTEVSKTNEAKYNHILDAPVPDIGAPLLVPKSTVPTSTVRKLL